MSKKNFILNLREFLTRKYLKETKRISDLKVPQEQKTFIDKTTFEGYDQLEHLGLTYSNVDLINPGSFQNCKNLKNLILPRDGSCNINEQTLEGLETLESIFVGNLDYIKPNAFKNMRNIKYFVFSGENFDFKYIESFKKLETLQITAKKITQPSDNQILWNYFPKLWSVHINSTMDAKNLVRGYWTPFRNPTFECFHLNLLKDNKNILNIFRIQKEIIELTIDDEKLFF